MTSLPILNSKIKSSIEKELFPTETHTLHTKQIIILMYRQSSVENF